MTDNKLAVGAGLIAASVLAEAVEYGQEITPIDMGNMVAGGMTEWLLSGQPIETWLWAIEVDVDSLKRALRVNRLDDLEAFPPDEA